MGGKGNKKKKGQKKPQADANENPSPQTAEQDPGNQSRSNNQQGSDNRPMSGDSPGSGNSPGSNDQQKSEKKPKSNSPQGSGSQTKSKNQQGSVSQAGSSNQASDNNVKSKNLNRPRSNSNQQALSETTIEQFPQLSISSDNKKRQQTQQTSQGQSAWGQSSIPAPQGQSAWGQSSIPSPQGQSPWGQSSMPSPQGQNPWGQPSISAPQAQSPWGQPSKTSPQTQGAWGQSSKSAPQAQSPLRQPNKPASQDQSAWGESSKSNTPKQSPKQQRDDSVGKQSPALPSKSVTSPTTKMPHLLCPYKDSGKRGQIYKLETNYLELKIDKLKKFAYHYDVQIEPDKPKKHLSKIFQQFSVNNFPGTGIAFDGTHNAYAPMRLNLNNVQGQVDFVHPDTGNVRTHNVIIKETEDMEIPLHSLQTYRTTRQYDAPKRALQCLEIILKGAYHQPHLDAGVQAARSFYLPPDGNRLYLQDFSELWLGLFQSTVLGSRIYMNVDVCHKAFPKRYASLVDLLDEIAKEHHCDLKRALSDMHSHLSGLDVMYQTPANAANRRVYKYLDLGESPKYERFKDANGREITVASYFKELGYPISDLTLPCVKLGNSIKYIAVPMEHCSLLDRQAINKKCTENQTRNMIDAAATSTDVRKEKIMNLVNRIAHNQSPIIRGFGVEVGMKFAEVPARLLDPPMIQYGGNNRVVVRNGVWRGEGIPFFTPESANKWAILNTNQRTKLQELNDLAKNLFKYSQPTNLNLAGQPTYTHTVDCRDISSIERELEIAKEKGIRILFCVIPDSGQTYAKIKQLAETRIGVLTQCIKGGTMFRKRNDTSTISNILLKVNAKLNGTNHVLNTSPILKKDCMFIGADVTHPSPEQKNIPSVVGVAASHDPHAFRYNVCWRLQGPRIEIIEDFQQIIFEHLQYYKQKNGYLPSKIFYYRDGVSEGQFQHVMANEKMAMTQACAAIQPGYEKKVKLTIIVVQKRHHTRFFPGQNKMPDRTMKDRNNNVPAGTIVDTDITHPNENHFYLVSHQSIQGVAKPTKYCILLDEGQHSIDDLQGLSFNLCHLFTRCNRSVSYPAPTYYAHLAAYRGRVYIENERLNMSRLTDEWRKRAIRDDIVRQHPMFFV